ncbi:MAG: SLBB domain-containing protein [Gemmatimonadaceae bacterium]
MTTLRRPWVLGIAALLVAPALAAQDAARAPVVPGDRFVLRVLVPDEEPQFLLVDDRHTVVIPLAGPLSVRGLGAHDALDSVSARVAQFIRPGAFTVDFERRIAVLGDVHRPDLHYLDLTLRLRDALALAGGVSETGRAREVVLIRGATTERILDWQTTAAGDRELRSGDQLVVPKERWYKRNALPLISALGVLASIGITLGAR